MNNFFEVLESIYKSATNIQVTHNSRVTYYCNNITQALIDEEVLRIFDISLKVISKILGDKK